MNDGGIKVNHGKQVKNKSKELVHLSGERQYRGRRWGNRLLQNYMDSHLCETFENCKAL